MMVLLQENINCVNRAGVTDKGPVHGGADVNRKHCRIIIQRLGITDTEQKLRLRSLNVGGRLVCVAYRK